MSIEHQLLQAIAAAPTDDAPRLTYADWLGERGDPRAEFIRLDCRIASMPPEAVQRLQLEPVRDQMAEDQVAAWNAPLTELGFHVPAHCHERGLADHLHGSFAAFRANFHRALEITPWVTQMIFENIQPEEVERLALLPALGLLRSIALECDELAASQLAVLGKSRHASQIEEFFIDGLEIGDEGARAIAAGTWRSLGDLSLGSCCLTSAGVEALGASGLPLRKLVLDLNETIGAVTLSTAPAFRQLKELSISHCELTSGDFADIANGEWPALEVLDCGGNEVDGEGLRALLAGRNMSRLHTLELGDTEVGQAFAGEPIVSGLPALKTMRLTACEFDQPALRTLAASEPVLNLTELDLDQNEDIEDGLLPLLQLRKLESLTIDAITNASVDLLAAGNWPALQHLVVEVDALEPHEMGDLFDVAANRGCQLSLSLAALPGEMMVKYLSYDWPIPITRWEIYEPEHSLELRTLAAILALPQAMAVTEIDFTSCGLTHQHCQLIADAASLRGLTQLAISSNDVGDQGLIAIANSPHLGPLTSLRLEGVGIGDAGMRALSGNKAMRLEHLRVAGNTISSAGVVEFVSSSCSPNLEWFDLSNNEIDDEGVHALAHAPSLKQLTWLQLDNNPLTESGARELLESPGLPSLNDVDIDCEGVSEELQEQFPHG